MQCRIKSEKAIWTNAVRSLLWTMLWRRVPGIGDRELCRNWRRRWEGPRILLGGLPATRGRWNRRVWDLLFLGLNIFARNLQKSQFSRTAGILWSMIPLGRAVSYTEIRVPHSPISFSWDSEPQSLIKYYKNSLINAIIDINENAEMISDLVDR